MVNINRSQLLSGAVLVGVLTLLIVVFTKIFKKHSAKENFDNSQSPDIVSALNSNYLQDMENQSSSEDGANSLDSFFKSSVVNPETEYSEKTNSVENKTELNATEFLPQELNVDWFDKDFNTVKEIDQETLIDISKYSSGIDTVGQSLKNPSYDIRGNIANPKNIISPFLNSSIEPDNNIRGGVIMA